MCGVIFVGHVLVMYGVIFVGDVWGDFCWSCVGWFLLVMCGVMCGVIFVGHAWVGFC